MSDKVLDITNKLEEKQSKREKMLSRVENCFLHMGLGDPGTCEYCKQRTALSYKIIHYIDIYLRDLYKSNKLEFTTMDIRYTLKEAFERMDEIEQELAEQKEAGETKEGTVTTLAGGKPETTQGNPET